MSKIKKNCILSFTTPGYFDKDLMELLSQQFKLADLDMRKVDSVAGWWNLNQDWYEVHDICDTHWDHVRPMSLSQTSWQWLHNRLKSGQIIMMVHYVNDDGTIEEHC